MSSGVQVDDKCKLEFNEIKIRKTARYIIYKLSDDLKKIEVEKKAEKEATYEQFLADLRLAEESGQCRYGVFDMPYVTSRGQENAKLVFIYWSPDTANIKQKMVYAASKDALKSELGDGIAAMIQANDHDDLLKENILAKIK